MWTQDTSDYTGVGEDTLLPPSASLPPAEGVLVGPMTKHHLALLQCCGGRIVRERMGSDRQRRT